MLFRAPIELRLGRSSSGCMAAVIVPASCCQDPSRSFLTKNYGRIMKRACFDAIGRVLDLSAYADSHVQSIGSSASSSVKRAQTRYRKGPVAWRDFASAGGLQCIALNDDPKCHCMLRGGARPRSGLQPKM
jgi:hypothetical protein